MSGPERVRLTHHTDRSPARIPIGSTGSTGTIVRRDVGARGHSGIVFVRWDGGDRAWHPTTALASIGRLGVAA